MAYRNKEQSRTAEGFLNLVFTDSEGNEHRFRKGVALESSNRLERSILNKAAADSGYVMTLTGTVHIVQDVDLQEDIAL